MLSRPCSAKPATQGEEENGYAKAKHLALAAEKLIFSLARFFASLRFAQNDKVLYAFANKIIMISSDSKSVSLS